MKITEKKVAILWTAQDPDSDFHLYIYYVTITDSQIQYAITEYKNRSQLAPAGWCINNQKPQDSLRN